MVKAIILSNYSQATSSFFYKSRSINTKIKRTGMCRLQIGMATGMSHRILEISHCARSKRNFNLFLSEAEVEGYRHFWFVFH